MRLLLSLIALTLFMAPAFADNFYREIAEPIQPVGAACLDPDGGRSPLDWPLGEQTCPEGDTLILEFAVEQVPGPPPPPIDEEASD